MKKKFLVLGIGNAQVDLLARLSGWFEVHALSNTAYGRGLPYVDFFSLIDITDTHAVLAYARAHKVDYLYSVGSDVAMPTVTYVSEQLGLPTLVNHSVASMCNNKVELRKQLRGVYGSVAFDLLVDSQQFTTVPFPAMIKPVDSQGQRGVQTITEINQIPKAFETAVAYSRCGQAIIEEKIIGQEISVNIYMADGAVEFFLPSERIAWPQFDGGIIQKHVLPTSLPANVVQNVRRLVVETTSALGIKNGPVYFQIIVRGDDPYLIEVTPRLDGCHMWNLISHATGIDLLEITISHLQGLSIVCPENFKVTPGVLEFFCLPPHETFSGFSPNKFAKHIEWYLQPGEKVRPMNGFMEKCGYQIVLENEK